MTVDKFIEEENNLEFTTPDEIKRLMIAFAKYHCEQQVKAIEGNIEHMVFSYQDLISKSEVLNQLPQAYPLSQIT